MIPFVSSIVVDTLFIIFLYYVLELDIPETNELCIWFWPDPTSPGGPKALIPIKAKQKKKDAPSSFMRTDGAGNRNRPVIIKLELSKRSRPRKTGLI